MSAWDDSEIAARQGEGPGNSARRSRSVDLAPFDTLVLSARRAADPSGAALDGEQGQSRRDRVIGDTEFFQREIAGSGANLVAITGTNGKSTTTALIGHLFASAGRDVEIGGNIGKAVFSPGRRRAGRVYVLELSSYQIDLMPTLKPDVGVLQHHSRSPRPAWQHGTLRRGQSTNVRQPEKGDIAVVGVDEDWGAKIADESTPARRLSRLGRARSRPTASRAPDGILRERQQGQDRATIDLARDPRRSRQAQLAECRAAYGAARALGLAAKEIERGMHSFPGLAHRMEEVGHAEGILFINDSKATNADAAAKALASFDPIYWIAGGIAKAGGIDSLKPLFGRS